jgi:hypothetical protein
LAARIVRAQGDRTEADFIAVESLSLLVQHIIVGIVVERSCDFGCRE